MAKAKSLNQRFAETEPPNRGYGSAHRFEDQFDAKTKAELAELRADYNAGKYPGWSQSKLRDWLMKELGLQRLAKATIAGWLKRDD